MIRPKPIHIEAIGPKCSMRGTAFLVRRNEKVWITTVAHLFSGMSKPPSDPSYFIGAKILERGTEKAVPLYNEQRHRFTVYGVTGEDYLVDMLTLELNEGEIEMLSEHGSFDYAKIKDITQGEDVAVHGYPNGAILQPHESFVGRVLNRDDLTFTLSEPSKLGYSGGPATKGGDLVGLAYGDVSTTPILTNARILNLSRLKEYYF